MSISDSGLLLFSDSRVIAPYPEEIKPVLDFKRQMVISVAGGVTLNELKGYFTKDSMQKQQFCPVIFRIIPNIAIEVKSSMTFVSAYNASQEQIDLVMSIYNELGHALFIEERLMAAGTSLASSGIAFALRYVRAAVEGGIELGFYPREAQDIVINTIRDSTRHGLTAMTIISASLVAAKLSCVRLKSGLIALIFSNKASNWSVQVMSEA